MIHLAMQCIMTVVCDEAAQYALHTHRRQEMGQKTAEMYIATENDTKTRHLDWMDKARSTCIHTYL